MFQSPSLPLLSPEDGPFEEGFLFQDKVLDEPDQPLLSKHLFHPQASNESCSLQGPVGARLLHFWETWQERGADPWVVSVLRFGFRIPFIMTPTLSSIPLSLSAYAVDSEKFLVLKKEVSDLLEK